MKQLEIKIRGVVQGVGFRNFTQKTAIKWGVIGTVENQSDGSVLVRASASDSVMKQFLDELKKGPKRSQVKEIHTKPIQDENFFREHSSFTIVRGNL